MNAFTSGISILTVVLGTFGVQAARSAENQGKDVEPQGRYFCAATTWRQIRAICPESGGGHETRNASALA
jgi:hypothetical protein